MTEQELRQVEVPWLDTPEELIEYIHSVSKQPLEYGPAALAAGMAATATLRYVARKLGLTGYQMSWADLEVVRRNRHLEALMVFNLEDLLYPQHRDRFPTWEGLTLEHQEWLASMARRKLAWAEEHNITPVPEVRAHWERLSSLFPEPDATVEVRDGE